VSVTSSKTNEAKQYVVKHSDGVSDEIEQQGNGMA
jgi:hypothetical protein